jgi:hypothetical protein
LTNLCFRGIERRKPLILDPNQIYYSKTCSASLSKKLLARWMKGNSFFLDWEIGWTGVGQDILAQDPGAHLVLASPNAMVKVLGLWEQQN